MGYWWNAADKGKPKTVTIELMVSLEHLTIL
jgi:hypothetical protein